jgi:RNA polymerase sigma-70 factor, ECF subfamily
MGANSDPDAELMLLVKRGDLAAFEVLVNKYQRPVMNLVYRTLRDATEAEDLTQAVFVQVFKSASRYRPTARFSTWLYTIARNLCLNELRRRTRHPAESLDAASAAGEDAAARQVVDRRQPDPTEMALRDELEEKIAQALAELPENQRTALLLFRNEELSYEEIARILGCSLSATKSLIHRARETLKGQLRPYLRTGAWKAP